jgi:hypothetical protein
MAAKKTEAPAKTRKPRTPKPVNDLPSAAAAYKRAQVKATKAQGAYAQAERDHDAAQGELKAAREVMERFYRETLEGAPAEDTTGPVDAVDYEPEPEG